jgi:hypothetical protein
MTAMKLAALVIASVVLSGCAGRQRVAATSRLSFERGQYSLRFITTTIDPLREDGTPWHVTKPDETPAIVGAVIGLAAGQPEIGMAVGNAIADKGGKPSPPLPAIRTRVSGGKWRSVAALQPTYAPTFQDGILIDASAMTGDELVIIQVIDSIDGTLIAYAAPTFAELVAHEHQTVQLTGQASRLELELRFIPEGDGADETTLREMSEGL